MDFIFAQAVRCARAIGVFQWQHLHNRSESELQDYKNIAHCLYILDKQICWTAGVHPRVLKSEIQLDFTHSAGVSESLAIKAELAAIEESIYLQVYASNVRGRTEDEVMNVVIPINRRLDEWLVKSGVDLETTIRQPGSWPAHAELVLGSLCAKLLLLWPFRKHPDPLCQQYYGNAATCVRLMVSLWESGASERQHIFLPL